MSHDNSRSKKILDQEIIIMPSSLPSSSLNIIWAFPNLGPHLNCTVTCGQDPPSWAALFDQISHHVYVQCTPSIKCALFAQHPLSLYHECPMIFDIFKILVDWIIFLFDPFKILVDYVNLHDLSHCRNLYNWYVIHPRFSWSRTIWLHAQHIISSTIDH